jgi:NADPH:quinone reductase-like Zn-dependent oxidoreductase
MLRGLLLVALSAFVVATHAATIPEMARKVVLAKKDSRFAYKTIQAPVPKPGPGQLLVRMRAVSLNRGDLEILSYKSNPPDLVPASDGAGEVVAVGPGARQFKVGDRVTSLYFPRWADGPPTAEKMKESTGADTNGVLADYVVLDETAVLGVPAGWSFVEASTLPTAGLTAWSAVMVEGRAGPGKVVLVQGTGGVSTFALQLAHAAGAKVIVTSSSDEKLQRARQLGADETINYTAVPEWGQKVLDLTGGKGADVIIEVGGRGTITQSGKALARFGTISLVGGLTGYGGDLSTVGLINKTARAVGILVGSRAQLKDLQAFMTAHRVKPVVEKIYSLDQLDEAMKQLADNRFVGKIVIQP